MRTRHFLVPIYLNALLQHFRCVSQRVCNVAKREDIAWSDPETTFERLHWKGCPYQFIATMLYQLSFIYQTFGDRSGELETISLPLVQNCYFSFVYMSKIQHSVQTPSITWVQTVSYLAIRFMVAITCTLWQCERIASKLDLNNRMLSKVLWDDQRAMRLLEYRQSP